ncbi:SGNH/GDSL hydrolase family protein [Neolewinella lacunae]|uniref:SGNH/GDSL hydrolase family protein n=1 Tax=Neolewinella lacunae TaxID=1517758 RepID=A0A923T8T6_9BACT|nr:SGNH/GDSL hydrolase family protein [Neolewinella lacunae]MBC6994318.1 SGNH/GDSL hydrolase family protein [Neolewinella lacunae]MDN3634923.1 SGNH/GDSL hydrolase family protein [Neolewinella lacunae]
MKIMPTLLSVFLFFIFACQDDDAMLMTPANPDPMPTDSVVAEITYLALGDSYTIGTSVAAEDRWPVQLSAALAQRGIRVTDQRIVATNGWTTRNLLNGIASADLAPTYDLVSLLIGVNNQFQGRSLSEYRTEFTELLDIAIQRAGGDTSGVFVVSIPDYAFTPFGNGREDISNGVANFNAAAKAITESYGIPFYNITPISQEGLANPSLVATDNLHPSGEQYTRWVEEVLLAPVAAGILD